MPDSGRFPSAGNALLWVLTLIALGFLVVMLTAKKHAPFLARRAFFLLAGGLTAAGTVIVPVALTYGQGPASFALFLAGAAAVSFGNALLLIMWGELWSALATGRVGRHLYVSYTFAFVLFFAANALPFWAAVAFNALMPIISAAILTACKQEPRREPSVLPLDVRTVPVLRILVCILVISIAYGTSQGMVNTFADGDASFIAKALLLAGGGIAAITLSMVVAPSSAEPIALYRPVIPAMVAGLILLLLLPPTFRFLARDSSSWACTAWTCS